MAELWRASFLGYGARWRREERKRVLDWEIKPWEQGSVIVKIWNVLPKAFMLKAGSPVHQCSKVIIREYGDHGSAGLITELIC